MTTITWSTESGTAAVWFADKSKDSTISKGFSFEAISTGDLVAQKSAHVPHQALYDTVLTFSNETNRGDSGAGRHSFGDLASKTVVGTVRSDPIGAVGTNPE